jgi:hypothetical protein
VEQIHADGWQVENYQFPLIADERQAGSALLQRLASGRIDFRSWLRQALARSRIFCADTAGLIGEYL